jgi:heat shock protein HtpX
MASTPTANWRAVLAQNQRKTFGVIAMFVFIYVAIGLLVDLYIHGGFIAGQFETVLTALITFQITPMAMLTMLIVAVISLWITYAFHDRIMLLGTEYHEVTGTTARTSEEKQLYNIIEELKIAAGFRYMPKVYLIDADYMNAFASGYSEKSAMIAVTRGLMQKLNREELAAVMAHELSHIRHGDIRLTLTASILSNLMLIVVDIFFYSAIFSGRGSRDRNDNKFIIIIILLRYLLPLVTVLLMLYLSRTREYMADAGAVELLRDNHPLARALLKISGDYDNNTNRYGSELAQTAHEDVRRAAYIFDPFTDGFHPVKSLSTLFSTHPTVVERLKALGFQSTRDI